MTTSGVAPTDRVTHVLVGYSALMTAELDRLLPEDCVLILEEPHVMEARGVTGAAARHRCVAAVHPAPTQDEKHPDRLTDLVQRPPNVRAVVPAVEYGVVAAAVLARSWGLPGSGPGAARFLRDKLELRKTAGRHGIAQPDWAEAAEPDDVERFRARYGGACVLKPANRQASLGVQLLTADDDTPSAWLHTTSADEPRLRARYADDARYAVEERLTGPEVSVEALAQGGRVGFANITAKKVLPGRYPVELGHSVPAPLTEEWSTLLRAATAELVDAIGFGTGILHAEWVLTRGRPHLIECAGRLPGDRIHSLIDLAYDHDILRDLMSLLEGGGPAPARPAVRGAAVRFLSLPALPASEVTEVTAVDEARALPGVAELVVNVTPGTPTGEVTNSWQRAGYVITTGPDAETAEQAADRAAGHVGIEVGKAGAALAGRPDGGGA